MFDSWEDNRASMAHHADDRAEGARHQMADAKLVERFVLGGNATFTLQSVATGKRFTYKVSTPNDFNPDRPIWFVNVLTGQDNDHDFSYVGQIKRAGISYRYEHGRKARMAMSAPAMVAFIWWSRHMFERDHMPEGVEFWHEGRCGACGRKLTVPESIELGFGPDCAERLGL